MDIVIRLIADGTVVVIFLLAAYGLLTLVPRTQWVEKGWRVVAAGVTSYAAAKVIGQFFQPETLRPFEKLGVEAGAAYLPNPGFPSDHVLFAVFLTLAVWFSTKNRGLTTIMGLLTVVMATGRVLALVHTPLDVVGGAIIAFVGMIWYYVPKPTVSGRRKT